MLFLRLLPVLLRTHERRDAMLCTNQAFAGQLVNNLADGVLRDPKLLMQLVKAGDGVSRFVLAVPDAAAQLVGNLLPAGAVGRPNDLPIHLFDHGGDGRASHNCLPKRTRAGNRLLEHATAWHSSDQAALSSICSGRAKNGRGGRVHHSLATGSAVALSVCTPGASFAGGSAGRLRTCPRKRVHVRRVDREVTS